MVTLTALVTLALAAAGVEAARINAEAVVLDGAPDLSRLAAAGNGQVVFGLEGSRGALHAIDPLAPSRTRVVVSAPGSGVPRPVALAVLDSTVVAAVCREGDRWDVRTWRIKPEEPVAFDRPLQVVALGTASGGVDAEVDLAVGRGRDWIAVSGLPKPLAPVLRAALAGVRVGPLTTRSCPALDGEGRPVAVTVGPRDELVLVERDGAGVFTISYHDHTGRCLLRLPTGLAGLGDLAFAPDGGILWAAATDAQGNAGLWRLDATLRDGRQAIRPELVLARSGPRAVTAPTPRTMVVSHGGGTSSAPAVLERVDCAIEVAPHEPGGDGDGDAAEATPRRGETR